MNFKYPFDRAVADYVSSLSEERKSVLRQTVMIPWQKSDWPWFVEVIERYKLRDKGSPVRRDINDRLENDPNELNSEWWSVDNGGEPVFEAMKLLSAASAVLQQEALASSESSPQGPGMK